MKMVLINSDARAVKTFEGPGYDTLCSFFPRGFALAGTLANGDKVYADDEGLIRPAVSFFRIKGISQPLPGIGLVLGAEDDDREESTDVKSLTHKIRKSVTWMNRLEFERWADIQKTPAMTICGEPHMSWHEFAKLSRPPE